MPENLTKQMLIHLREQLTVHQLRSKVRRFAKENKRPDDVSYTKEQIRLIKRLWGRLPRKPALSWHLLYGKANGVLDHRYCPEDLFYAYIEPSLNSREMSAAYSDKNNLNKIFDVRTPKTILRCINGYFYNHDYDPIKRSSIELPEGEYVLKPSTGNGGGESVERIRIRGNLVHTKQATRSAEEVSLVCNNNFIIQEIVPQAAELSAIHPHSVNTLRIATLRIDNEAKHLSSVLRYGMGGSFVDNQRTGGASVGVKPDGTLRHYAFDKYGNRAAKHRETEIVFAGYEIPGYSRAVELVKELHLGLPYFDMVSWDVIIDNENQAVILEVNLMRQGINLHQFTNGPLFGEHTEYVLSKVLSGRGRNRLMS